MATVDEKRTKEYTENDLQTINIYLFDTNALYQNYDPTSNKPKSSRSSKWTRLVKPFWSELNSKKPILQPSKLADAFEKFKTICRKWRCLFIARSCRA